MIKISVVVPVYNTAKYLKKCLSSIVEQTFKDIEIIIINDKSTDNSLEIIKKYLLIDKRIILIDKKRNEGLSAARNSGIKIARGEYIIHVDGDDWIEFDYLESMYKYAKRNKADIVISDYYKDYNNNNILYVTEKTGISKEEILKNIFICKCNPCVWNKLIKMELYKKNKIYHPVGISIGEDLAVIPKLLFYSKNIVKLNKAYYHYIQNDSSLTRKTEKNNKKLYDIYEVVKLLENFFRGEKYYIEEMKINYLSGWILYGSNNIYEEKYKKIIKEYTTLFKNANLKNLSSLKIKCLYFYINIFKNINLLNFIIDIKNREGNKNG